ncbi:MAG: hypothetical protein AB1760_00080 [Pseudomonadota bacterium]
MTDRELLPYEVKCPVCGKVSGYSSQPEPEGVECTECFAKAWEEARTRVWSRDVQARNKRYEPELGQAIFGNRWAELQMPEDVDDYATLEIDALDARLGGVDEIIGPDFEMRSYYWGDCICEGDTVNPDCRACKPNFKFKDIEIRWYKHPGRGMSVNRPVKREELEIAFDRIRRMIAIGMIKKAGEE